MARKTGNNKGFSLIELLVGVLILALVVSPLLHTMVTAMRTAQKSRTAHNMTLMAQSLVETVNADGLNNLLGGLSVSESVTLNGLADQAALYRRDADGAYIRLSPDDVSRLEKRADTYYLGVTGLRFAGEKMPYDAMVTLDASEHSQNEYPIADYTSMDGVFCQPSDKDENPDIAAASFFADAAMLLREELSDPENPNPLYPVMDAEDFYFEMQRHISVNISLQPDATGSRTGTLIAAADFQYTAEYGGISLDPYNYSTDFYRSQYDLNASNYGVKSVYFFYYPSYFVGTTKESIDLYNLSDVPLRFFLVKQRTPAYFAFPDGYNPTPGEKAAAEAAWNAKLLTCENTYGCSLKLREAAHPSMTRDPVASVFTNLQTNIINEPSGCGSSVFRVLKGSWSIQLPVPDKLVETEKLNRLYTVKAELFRSGAAFQEEARLMTFTGSSVE